MADAIALDDGVARLIIFRNAICAHRDRLVALGSQIGIDVRKYEMIAKHLQRSVNQQVFNGGDNVWMSRENRRLYDQPFSKFIENMLRSEAVELTIEELTAELTADAREAS